MRRSYMRVVIFPCLLLILAACAAPGKAGQTTEEHHVPPGTPTKPLAQPTAGQVSSQKATSTTRPSTAVPTDTPPPSPALPTDTPSPTPVPLTKAAIVSCPVSLPNLSTSPNDYYILTYAGISAYAGYGNASGTLFTEPWPGGKVVFTPEGPGAILPDGSLAMKWPWYRHNVVGQLAIEGRRLDAPAPPLRAEIPCCYDETGFQPSELIFPNGRVLGSRRQSGWGHSEICDSGA